MVASSSSKVLGTSKETTSSVTAKAKTASEKPSMRETSSPRQRKPSSPTRLRANPSRTTAVHPARRQPISHGSDTMIKERPEGAQDRTRRGIGEDLLAKGDSTRIGGVDVHSFMTSWSS